MAKMGYNTRRLCGHSPVPFYFSVGGTPPSMPSDCNAGPHQTMATLPPGRPVFGYLTRKRYPVIITAYPTMAGLFDHISPTAHHAPSEFHPTLSRGYRRRRTRNIYLVDVHTRFDSPDLSLSFHENATSEPRSLCPSTKTPPISTAPV